jgi:hypothetical protein
LCGHFPFRTPVVVANECSGLINEFVAFADDSIKDIQIPTAWQGRASIQRFIKPMKLLQHRGPERHVTSAPNAYCLRNKRKPASKPTGSIERQNAPRETAGEATVGLEQFLRMRLQLEGKDETRYSASPWKRTETFHQGSHPERIGFRIVIQKGDDIPCRHRDRTIPRDIKSRAPLRNIPCMGKDILNQDPDFVLTAIIDYKDLVRGILLAGQGA